MFQHRRGFQKSVLRKKEPDLLDKDMRYKMKIFIKESRDTR